VVIAEKVGFSEVEDLGRRGNVDLVLPHARQADLDLRPRHHRRGARLREGL